MTLAPRNMAINLFDQSEAARKRGDRNAARQLLQASIRTDDTLPGSWYNLGVDAQGQKSHVQAVAALRDRKSVV